MILLTNINNTDEIAHLLYKIWNNYAEPLQLLKVYSLDSFRFSVRLQGTFIGFGCSLHVKLGLGSCFKQESNFEVKKLGIHNKLQNYHVKSDFIDLGVGFRFGLGFNSLELVNIGQRFFFFFFFK